MPTGIP